jgi:hypothetical protein
MSLADFLFGRPLKWSEERRERVGPAAEIAIFGLDALGSAAYAPGAAGRSRTCLNRPDQRQHHHSALDCLLFLPSNH